MNDGVISGLPRQPRIRCQVGKTATQTVGAAAFTKVVWESVIYDPYNAFDRNNNRFKAPTAGWYLSTWHNGAYRAAAAQRVLATVYKNGVQVRNVQDIWMTASSEGTGIQGAVVMYLEPSDYIEIYYYNSAGTDLSAAVANNHWEIERMSDE